LKKHSASVSVDGLTGSLSLNLLDRETGEVLESLPIRQATPQDKAFILSTWIRSYAQAVRRTRVAVGTESIQSIPQEVYLREEPIIAESLWMQCLVVGSSSASDEYTIHAWVCGSSGKLYHCYVPPELRGKGIAKALISHLCGTTLQYARPWPFSRVPNGWSFNPYLLRKEG